MEHTKLSQTILDSTAKIEELEVALETSEAKVASGEKGLKAAESKAGVLVAKMGVLEAELGSASDEKKRLESVSYYLSNMTKSKHADDISWSRILKSRLRRLKRTSRRNMII